MHNNFLEIRFRSKNIMQQSLGVLPDIHLMTTSNVDVHAHVQAMTSPETVLWLSFLLHAVSQDGA